MISAAGTVGDREAQRNSVLVSLSVAALSVIVACAINQPWEQVHTRDGAYYAYLAELLARGIIPYRDVFHIQGPILVWLGGLSAWLGGATGLIVQGALIGGLMTFGAALLGIGAQRHRSVIQILPVALVAWGVTSGWPFIGEFIVSGSRPKLLAIGLSAMAIQLLCAKHRGGSAAWCGGAFAAACWVWQPAATIAMGSLAGWTIARLLEEERAGFAELWQSALQLLLGAIVFSMAPIGVLLVQGSLDEFVSQALLYSVSTIGPRATWVRLAMLLPMPVMVVGGAGLLGFAASLFASLNPSKPDNPSTPSTPNKPSRLPARARRIRGAVFGWLAAYTALLWIDLDYRGDTLPLLLPLGVFAGALMSRVGELGAGWGRLLLAAILSFWLAGGDMLLPAHHSSHPYNPGQRIRKGAASDALEAARGRGVLIFADLLLAQKVGENPKHPYVYWEPNMVDYIERHEEGGINGFLDRLIAERYGAVTLGPRAGELVPYLLPKLRASYEARKPFRSNAYSFVLRPGGRHPNGR